MNDGLRRCRRTPAIVDRLLDDGLGAEDRAHIDGCRSCAAAIAEARRFEIALGRSAGGLVEEALPRSALDAPMLAPRRAAWAAPVFLVAATAVVVLAVAVAVSLAELGRGVGGPTTSPRPVDASLAVPGIGLQAARTAMLERGLACVPNDKGDAGLTCTGSDAATGASLYGEITQAGDNGVAQLKATMSVPDDQRTIASKSPQMGTERLSGGVSDAAFLDYFAPLATLAMGADANAVEELTQFMARTIGGANGSCQCERRIGEVSVVLEGSVGWSWDLVVSRR